MSLASVDNRVTVSNRGNIVTLTQLNKRGNVIIGIKGDAGIAADLKTTERLLITEGKITLPTRALGDIATNLCLLFESETSTFVMAEVTCHINPLNPCEVIFDQKDEVDGKWVVVSYLSARNQ